MKADGSPRAHATRGRTWALPLKKVCSARNSGSARLRRPGASAKVASMVFSLIGFSPVQPRKATRRGSSVVAAGKSSDAGEAGGSQTGPSPWSIAISRWPSGAVATVDSLALASSLSQ